MLRFRLTRILRLRNIDKPYSFLLKCGFHRTTANKYVYDGAVNIKVSHIEKLCRALNCTPNDLFDFKPGENDSIRPDHPLNELKRTENSTDIMRMYKELPLDKLDKVEEFIAQLKKE